MARILSPNTVIVRLSGKVPCTPAPETEVKEALLGAVRAAFDSISRGEVAVASGQTTQLAVLFPQSAGTAPDYVHIGAEYAAGALTRFDASICASVMRAKGPNGVPAYCLLCEFTGVCAAPKNDMPALAECNLLYPSPDFARRAYPLREHVVDEVVRAFDMRDLHTLGQLSRNPQSDTPYSFVLGAKNARALREIRAGMQAAAGLIESYWPLADVVHGKAASIPGEVGAYRIDLYFSGSAN